MLGNDLLSHNCHFLFNWELCPDCIPVLSGEVLSHPELKVKILWDWVAKYPQPLNLGRVEPESVCLILRASKREDRIFTAGIVYFTKTVYNKQSLKYVICFSQ